MAPALALGGITAALGAVSVPVSEIAEKLGAVSAAAAVAGALLLPRPRERAAATAATLVVVPVVLVGHIWNSEQFRSISGDPALFVALLLLGVAVVAGLAVLFARRPELFPILVVAALPFRIPIDAAGSTSNLLVPLYLVIAGAAVAHLWRQVEPDERARSRSPGRLELAVAGFIALYALQSLYSRDFDMALEHIVFFYVPFALLFKLLAEVRWSRSLLLACTGVLVLLALVFSGIGFWEYDRRELLWNPKVISANQFESYFRVNSVFWDPNVYGRFLALVMVIVATIALWNREERVTLGAAAVLAVLWGGLVLTFSQSSIASLLVGLAVLAALRWDPRRTAAVSALGLALGMIVVVGFQDALRVDLGSSSGLNRATSGRADLIEGGTDLFLARPLFGHGSGSFARTFRLERKGNQAEAVSASHTLPITIAAEQGLVGLIAYGVLLYASFGMLLGGRSLFARRSARAPPDSLERRDGAGPGGGFADSRGVGGAYDATLVALTAAYATLVAHTMMYAAFLEDPFTWVILGVGLGVIRWNLAKVPVGARELVAEPAPATA